MDHFTFPTNISLLKIPFSEVSKIYKVVISLNFFSWAIISALRYAYIVNSDWLHSKYPDPKKLRIISLMSVILLYITFILISVGGFVLLALPSGWPKRSFIIYGSTGAFFESQQDLMQIKLNINHMENSSVFTRIYRMSNLVFEMNRKHREDLFTDSRISLLLTIYRYEISSSFCTLQQYMGLSEFEPKH
jgi:hypothetical protein